jgi:hypothetical protein
VECLRGRNERAIATGQAQAILERDPAAAAQVNAANSYR